MIKKAALELCDNWKESLLVQNMNDGGMGSLSLFPKGKIAMDRKFGRAASEFSFNDIDGVLVLATLYLDTQEGLLELDMWKVNNDKLLQLPDL